jgi:hypothetical protein
MLGRDIGPIVLKVWHDENLIDQGLPPLDRICSGCGGSHYYGQLAEVQKPVKGVRVPDAARFRCSPCQARAEPYRRAPGELPRVGASTHLENEIA